jgi:hypothetical protein
MSMHRERFAPGDLIVMAIVGAGLTWGAALFRYLKRAGEHLYRNIPGEGLLTYALTKGQEFARVREKRLHPER